MVWLLVSFEDIDGVWWNVNEYGYFFFDDYEESCENYEVCV